MNFNEIIANLKRQFLAGGMYIKLIYINVGVFLIMSIIALIGALMKSPELAMQLELNLGAATDLNILLLKPWTIVTYMFVHGDFWHILMNMLLLFFFGRQIEAYLGSKKVLSIYVVGALVGLAVQIAAINIFPLFSDAPFGVIVGASGGVFALMVALATYAPRLEVNLFGVFPMKLMWLVGGYFLLELLNVGQVSNVAHFTHVGGGIYGFLMVSQYKKGKDIAKWFDNLMAFFAGLFNPSKRKPKMKVKHSKFRNQKAGAKPKPPKDDIEFNARKVEQQKKLDAILDKIKVRGYDGLTKSEKDFLAKF